MTEMVVVGGVRVRQNQGRAELRQAQGVVGTLLSALPAQWAMKASSRRPWSSLVFAGSPMEPQDTRGSARLKGTTRPSHCLTCYGRGRRT